MKYGISLKLIRIVVNSMYFKKTQMVNSWQNSSSGMSHCRDKHTYTAILYTKQYVNLGTVGYFFHCVYVLLERTNIFA